MTVNLSMLAGAGAQFFDNNGVPLTGGLVYTYTAGTTTPQTTYTTSAGNVAHSNPIVLNSAGRVASGGEIWLTDAVSYKFVLQTSAAVTIATYDNITGNASGIVSSLAAPSGSSLVGFIQAGTGAVAITVQAKLRETVSVKDFGAVGNGVTDDTTAIQNALNSGAKTVHLLAGTYLVSGQLNVPIDVSLVGEGRQVTFITASGNTTGSFTNNAVVFKGGTAPTAMPDLASNVVKAQRTVTFASPHGLSVGDVFLIYNPTDGSFNSARAGYRSGEYCTVSDVISSTQVGLENGLYDSYIAADVDIYRCDTYCTGELRGFTAIAPGPGVKSIVRGIAVDFGHKIELDDLGARDSDNASFSIAKSYKVTGRSLDCFQWSEAPGFSTQYGISIANSQELDLTGTFVGFRHAIAFGGANEFAIPCRAGNVHDFVAKNSNGGLAAGDWHGNTEFCVYENGFVYGGGFNIAGNNNRITGIKAIGDDMALINGREILGCDHVVENIECYTKRNDTARGIINIGGNEAPMDAINTRFGGQYIFRNITINAPENTVRGVFVRNRGFVGAPFDVIVDNLVYIAPNSNSTSFPAVSIATVSGDVCSRVAATNITTLRVTVTPPLTISATDSSGGCLVRQDSLTGDTAVLTSTAVDFVDSSVTFVKSFAKAPYVMVNNNLTSTGADVCVSIARDFLSSGFTARYLRADIQGTNFAGVAARQIQWNASLREW